MKKRIIIVAVMAVILIAATVLYFAVIRPMTANTEQSGGIQNNTFLIFDRVGRENISAIKVHNASGDYTIKKKTLDDGSESSTNFEIEGFEDIQLSDETVASLVVASGYPVAFQCLTEEAGDEDIKVYGLDEPLAYWELTDTDGKTYRVEVGDRLLSGEGYYCRYMDKQECIYVINSTIENSVLKPVTAYVNPVLCYGVSENDYYTADDFNIIKGDEQFITVKQSKKADFVNPNSNIETHIEYPRMEKTSDTVFNSAMYSLATLKGTETVYVGFFDLDTGNEEFVKYGMDDPYYLVEFTYKNATYIFLISDLQDDGYYYAASGLQYGDELYGFSYIVRCEQDSLKWLENDVDYWVSEFAIQFSIGNVESIRLDYGDETMTFYLTHGVGEDGAATVNITNGEGFTIDDESAYIFRKFYITLLNMQSQGSSNLTEKEREALKSDSGSHMLTVTMKLTDGSSYEYSFYRYTTGRALLTINGEGDYYVYPDWVEKTINDLDRLLNFEWIDPYAKK